MITALISRLVILAFGTLYPAYASYKAVRTKDVKEYVKWMMYWIVFALFTCAETFTDVLLSFWFPFYYEIKIALVFWLLSPATKGSSFLYRNFVHPAFLKREGEIDEMLSTAKESGYTTLKNIGSKGFTFATNVILQTAIKGGGGLVDQLRKSYSLTDLSRGYNQPRQGDVPDIGQENPALVRRRIAGSTNAVDMHFAEVDVNIRSCPNNDLLGEIRSTDDISSGYSSTDQLYHEGVLTRSSSVSSTRGGRGRGSRSAQAKRSMLAEGDEMLEEPTNSIETDSPLPSCSSIPPRSPLPPSPPVAAQPLYIRDAEVIGDVQISTSPKVPPLSGLIVSEGDRGIFVEAAPVSETLANHVNASNNLEQEESFCNVNMSLTEQVPKLMEVIQLENQILDDLNSASSSMMSSPQNDIEESVLSGRIVIAPSSRRGSRTSISSDRSGKYNKFPAPTAPSQVENEATRDSPDIHEEFYEAESSDSIPTTPATDDSLYNSQSTSDSKPPSYYTVEDSWSSGSVTNNSSFQCSPEPDTVSLKSSNSFSDMVKRGSSQLFSVLRGSGSKKKK